MTVDRTFVFKIGGSEKIVMRFYYVPNASHSYMYQKYEHPKIMKDRDLPKVPNEDSKMFRFQLQSQLFSLGEKGVSTGIGKLQIKK